MCGWGPCTREASVWEACCWHRGAIKHALNCLTKTARLLYVDLGFRGERTAGVDPCRRIPNAPQNALISSNGREKSETVILLTPSFHHY